MRFVIPLLFILLFSACKKDSKKAPDVFYVLPQPVNVQVQAGQGSGHHKITDIWFYSSGIFRGIYPAGRAIPVEITSSSPIRLDFYAGIYNSGSSTSRVTYEPYKSIRKDTVAPVGSTLTIPLNFEYKNSVVFVWMEDFELPGYSLIKSSVADTNYVIHTADSQVFEGLRSAEFGLSGNKQLAQFESATSYTFPVTTQNIFMELSYKCNTEFEVGIESNYQYYLVRYITPKESWNKIYLYLTDAIRADNVNPQKKIIFKLKRNSDISEQKVWIDNIKVLYIP